MCGGQQWHGDDQRDEAARLCQEHDRERRRAPTDEAPQEVSRAVKRRREEGEDVGRELSQ